MKNILNIIYLKIKYYHKLILYFFIIFIFFTIIRCNTNYWHKNKVFAISLQPSLQQEIILSRIEQIIANKSLNNYEYSKILYKHDVLYDNLGLRYLTRNDFLTSLIISPDLPKVFNFLKIYFTQYGNHKNTYEAFGFSFKV